MLALQLLGMHSLGEEQNRTLLRYALDAKLLRVSAHLHKALQDYDPFIRCYLADTERRGTQPSGSRAAKGPNRTAHQPLHTRPSPTQPPP